MSFQFLVRLGLDGMDYERGLNHARSRADAFGTQFSSRMSAAAGAIGAAFTTMGLVIKSQINAAATEGDRIEDLAARVGFSPRAAQQADEVLRQNASSLEAATAATRKLAEAKEKALAGDKESIKAFKAFGVTLEDLQSRNLEQLFFQVAAGVKDAELNSKNLVAIMEILGKRGGELIPAFKEGFGKTVGDSSDETIKKLAGLQRAMERAGAAVKRFRNELVAKVSPGLTKVFETIADPFGHGRGLRQDKPSGLAEGLTKAEIELEKKDAKEKERLGREQEAREKRIADARAKSADAQRDLNFSRLKTPEERIAFLEKEKADAQKRALDISDPEKFFAAAADVARITQQIEGERSRVTKTGAPVPFIQDDLARIGATTASGGRGDRRLEEIAKHTKAIADNTRQRRLSSRRYP